MKDQITDSTEIKALERLIVEVENGIKSQDLSSLDIANYDKERKRIAKRFKINFANFGGTGSRLLASRYYEFSALIYRATNSTEMVDADMRYAYKFLPTGQLLISEFAKRLSKTGEDSLGSYIPRKMTISEHKQAVGSQTPGELSKNIFAYVVAGGFVLLILVAIYQQMSS